MLDYFAQHPFVLILTMCLCNPPGLLTAAGLFYLARRYNLRNPFVERGIDAEDV